MLILKTTENELKFFENLRNEYPENVWIKTEHGFDMNSSVQVVIDMAGILEVLIPSVIAAIEMAILYRIQKKQTIISEREAEVHEKELELQKEKYLLERAKAERNEFEIRISSNGENEILVKTNDILSLQNNPENLPQFMENLRSAIITNEEDV